MPTILIIDDEPALLLGLASKIRRHGYTVVTATDGSDGFRKAKELLPDLIISDVMMPPPNGFELRRLLSLEPGLASIPFIFLTARSNTDRLHRRPRMGRMIILSSPLRPRNCLRELKRFFVVCKQNKRVVVKK